MLFIIGTVLHTLQLKRADLCKRTKLKEGYLTSKVSLMIKSLTKLIAVGALTFASSFSNALQVDSFFDIFVDVQFDEASQSPILVPLGRVVTPELGSRKVVTEILSMSLSSHRGATDNSTQYHATVAFRSWIPGNNGRTSKADSFFDIIYVCVNEPEGREVRCHVKSSTPKTKGKHRGHVTVLK